MIPMPSIVVIGAVVAILAGAAGGWMARGVVADRQIAELQAQVAQERQRNADAARQAEVQARETEARRTAEIERIEHAARQRTESLAADATAARAAADSLRKHIARLATGRQAPSDSAPAVVGPSTEDSNPLLPDMFEKLVNRAISLAEYADTAHAAGLACEQSYAALRSGP